MQGVFFVHSLLMKILTECVIILKIIFFVLDLTTLWRYCMVRNNIEVDVKVKCIENETTQAQLAENIGTTGQYVNRIIKKKDGVVNKTFVQMMESLGYDIELTYVKKI